MSQKIKNKIKNTTILYWDKIKIPFSGVFIIILAIWFIKSTIEDMAMYQFTSLFHYGEIIYFNSYQIVLPLGIPIFFFAMVTVLFSFFRKGKVPRKIDFTMNFITLILIMLIFLTQLLCLLVTIWLGVFSPYKTCEPEGFRYYYVRDIGDCQRLMWEQMHIE
jgi:hypothetical protein